MFMGVALWPNQMRKNLGAIGNILGTASRNTLGTHWERRKKHQKIHVYNPPHPPQLLKNSYQTTTPFLVERKWLG